MLTYIKYIHTSHALCMYMTNAYKYTQNNIHYSTHININARIQKIHKRITYKKYINDMHTKVHAYKHLHRTRYTYIPYTYTHHVHTCIHTYVTYIRAYNHIPHTLISTQCNYINHIPRIHKYITCIHTHITLHTYIHTYIHYMHTIQRLHAYIHQTHTYMHLA